MLPYSRQDVHADDVAAVVEVLGSDWLTQGPAVGAFEVAVAGIVGARHAVAFSSGSAGLHAAVAAAGLGPGHRVAVPALTFVATANAARHVGAEVEFVDLDARTLGLDLTCVPAGVDAVVPVHYAGYPLDLGTLRHRPRVVIEDAAHALGAVGPDGPVGSCARSDMCVFSFHPVKVVTSAEGGIVTTNDDDLAHRLRRFRHHGITAPDPDRPWHHVIEEAGFNYRLSDVHAALGRHQVARLAEVVGRRAALAARYDDLLAELPVTLPPTPAAPLVNARHLYPVLVDGRDEVYRRMRTAGIGVQVHYVPLHHQPLFATVRRDLPVTDRVAARLLSLPLFPTMDEADQHRVVGALADALDHR